VVTARAPRRLLPLLLVACSPGFESRSIVLDLRMLGMRGDPPEVVEEFDPANPVIPDLPPVTLTALVADPGAQRRLAWTLVACPPATNRRCDGASLLVPLAEGSTDDPESASATDISGELRADAALLEAAFEGEQDELGFGGLQVMVELRVWPDGDPPDQAAVGSKRILYAPKIPRERTANTNPTLTSLGVDDAEPFSKDDLVPFEGGACSDGGLPPLEVAVETELRLEPVEPEGVRERYVLPTLDGGSREITENLRYAWFATAGSFSAEETGGPIDFFGNAPPLHTYWTAPAEAGPVDLWLVQRDERGGTSWQRRCFSVSAP